MRRPQGRWVAAVYLAGVLIKAVRINRISWARRWANRERDKWKRFGRVEIHVGHYKRNRWRPEPVWKTVGGEEMVFFARRWLSDAAMTIARKEAQIAAMVQP